jgi:hypothetical protein
MIKLAVSITYLETIEISDEQIAEYREEFPDASLDDIKEAYVQSMLDNKHHWYYNDVEYSEM